MKNKVVLVFLAIVLVASLVGFGACAAPAKRTMTPEEGRTLPAEEKAPPAEEKAPPAEEKAPPAEEKVPSEEEEAPAESGKTVKFKAGSDLAKSVRMAPPIGDLNVSPERPGSVQLTFTSTLPQEAKRGIVDIRYSTKQITGKNCLKTSPILPITSSVQGEPVPGADIFIEQEPDDEPSIEVDETEGEEIVFHVRGLEPNTTYYFVAWIIAHDKLDDVGTYKLIEEPDGDYKFADFQVPDQNYNSSLSNTSRCTTPSEEGALEVVLRDVEAEPSVILELKKGNDVVLQVMETILVEPTLTFYTAVWTPELGQYYWYAYAEWHKELPHYTYGFAMTAAAAPDISNHNTSRSNKEGGVIVSPDGDIEWNDKEAYLGLMKKLGKAMEEIGSRSDIINLLGKEVPGSASELIAKQERLLSKVKSPDYDEALVQLVNNLPYQKTPMNKAQLIDCLAKESTISNPGDVTYEELERVVPAIKASVIVIGTAADLNCHNPLIGACALAAMQPVIESISEVELR